MSARAHVCVSVASPLSSSLQVYTLYIVSKYYTLYIPGVSALQSACRPRDGSALFLLTRPDSCSTHARTRTTLYIAFGSASSTSTSSELCVSPTWRVCVCVCLCVSPEAGRDAQTTERSEPTPHTLLCAHTHTRQCASSACALGTGTHTTAEVLKSVWRRRRRRWWHYPVRVVRRPTHTHIHSCII